MNYLAVGGGLSLFAALAHIAIIIGGADWYRFFGAGENMATLAEQHSMRPTIITLGIATVLFIWALYAFAGSRLIRELPLQKVILVCITLAYLCRGILGFVLVLFPLISFAQENSATFWFWSSSICLSFGLIHFKGLVDNWHLL